MEEARRGCGTIDSTPNGVVLTVRSEKNAALLGRKYFPLSGVHLRRSGSRERKGDRNGRGGALGLEAELSAWRPWQPRANARRASRQAGRQAASVRQASSSSPPLGGRIDSDAHTRPHAHAHHWHNPPRASAPESTIAHLPTNTQPHPPR